MLRTHNCNQLTIKDVSKKVVLCGWVQKIRNLGGMTFIDVRDRFGITQLAFNIDSDSSLYDKARNLSREYVISVEGMVVERSSKNNEIQTGDIEIMVEKLNILNKSKTPPFTIEDNTDGGDEIRMKYRYLDIRRNPIKDNLILRAKVSSESRKYLDENGFIEVETPYLIKSTPEGARDFVVPSRMNTGEFYALPQSPQTFKQLLMVGGIDRYYQIVKCFRDEDLRSDRQPEFTQIDCEMSFVEQEDVLNMFEGLTKHLLKKIKNIEVEDFPRMKYDDAIKTYGTDKPDIRFGMKFIELNSICKSLNFKIFDEAELIVAINAKNCSTFSRREIDELTDYVKTPQVGATGLIYCRFNEDGSVKSSIDKFLNDEKKIKLKEIANCDNGDLLLIMAGERNKVRKELSCLRLFLANKLKLNKHNNFAPLWVVDFPLLEWDEENNRYHAMHHPFTAPKIEEQEILKSKPGEIKANAYDLVINGNEIGGGSVRIHDKKLQETMFNLLGFSEADAKKQFGFLMDAFEYGAPPHAGVAFGFDRLCAVLNGSDNIRDFIAFPKNNAGRDIMIDSPSTIDHEQLDELKIKLS